MDKPSRLICAGCAITRRNIQVISTAREYQTLCMRHRCSVSSRVKQSPPCSSISCQRKAIALAFAGARNTGSKTDTPAMQIRHSLLQLAALRLQVPSQRRALKHSTRNTLVSHKPMHTVLYWHSQSPHNSCTHQRTMS
eukprot:810531-Amphidinium_carterae.2